MTSAVQIGISEKCVGLPDGFESLAPSPGTSQRYVLVNCSILKCFPASDLRRGSAAFNASRETISIRQKIMLLKEGNTRPLGGDNRI